MGLVAVVGLGANLGDRLATMRSALGELRRIANVEKTSHVYASAPVGPIAQPEFLNAAVVVSFPNGPEALLEALLAIESKLGRVRGERWGPRTIDLDLLWVKGVKLEGERLEIPHPRLRDRAFALAPLLEIVPDAIDPRSMEPYAVPAGDCRMTPEIL